MGEFVSLAMGQLIGVIVCAGVAAWLWSTGQLMLRIIAAIPATIGVYYALSSPELLVAAAIVAVATFAFFALRARNRRQRAQS